MEEKITVFMFALNEDSVITTREVIEENNNFEWIGNTNDKNECIKKCLFIKPKILFIDISDIQVSEIAAEIIGELKSRGLKIFSVLLIKKGMTYNMRKLIQEGANDFIYSPLNNQTLMSVYETYLNTYSKLDKFKEHQRDISSTKVISFFSPKGGVGKTFISLNVAAGLASLLNKRVLFVDLSFPYSDVPIILNISTNNKNIYDLMIFLEQNPNKSPQDYLLEIEDLGFYITLPPRSLIETSYIISHIHELKQTLQILRTYFDWTIIDLPPRYYDIIPIVFELTNENFGIITPEGETAVMLQQFHEELMAQGLSINMKVILNRNNRKIIEVIGKEWRLLVPQGIFAEIEDDPLEAGIANNLGELAITRKSKSKLNSDLIKLVQKISQI